MEAVGTATTMTTLDSPPSASDLAIYFDVVYAGSLRYLRANQTWDAVAGEGDGSCPRSLGHDRTDNAAPGGGVACASTTDPAPLRRRRLGEPSDIAIELAHLSGEAASCGADIYGSSNGAARAGTDGDEWARRVDVWQVRMADALKLAVAPAGNAPLSGEAAASVDACVRWLARVFLAFRAVPDCSGHNPNADGLPIRPAASPRSNAASTANVPVSLPLALWGSSLDQQLDTSAAAWPAQLAAFRKEQRAAFARLALLDARLVSVASDAVAVRGGAIPSPARGWTAASVHVVPRPIAGAEPEPADADSTTRPSSRANSPARQSMADADVDRLPCLQAGIADDDHHDVAHEGSQIDYAYDVSPDDLQPEGFDALNLEGADYDIQMDDVENSNNARPLIGSAGVTPAALAALAAQARLLASKPHPPKFGPRRITKTSRTMVELQRVLCDVQALSLIGIHSVPAAFSDRETLTAHDLRAAHCTAGERGSFIVRGRPGTHALVALGGRLPGPCDSWNVASLIDGGAGGATRATWRSYDVRDTLLCVRQPIPATTIADYFARSFTAFSTTAEARDALDDPDTVPRRLALLDAPVDPSGPRAAAAPRALQQCDIILHFNHTGRLPRGAKLAAPPPAIWADMQVCDAGAITPLHVDPWGTDALLAMCLGRKRIVLYPTSEFNTGRTRDQVAAADAGRLGQTARDRLTADCRGPACWVDIAAGDCIFIAAGTPHAVLTLEPSIALSVNIVTPYNLASFHAGLEDEFQPGDNDTQALYIGAVIGYGKWMAAIFGGGERDTPRRTTRAMAAAATASASAPRHERGGLSPAWPPWPLVCPPPTASQVGDLSDLLASLATATDRGVAGAAPHHAAHRKPHSRGLGAATASDTDAAETWDYWVRRCLATWDIAPADLRGMARDVRRVQQRWVAFGSPRHVGDVGEADDAW